MSTSKKKNFDIKRTLHNSDKKKRFFSNIEKTLNNFNIEKTCYNSDNEKTLNKLNIEKQITVPIKLFIPKEQTT
jgi:hypothetical protein